MTAGDTTTTTAATPGGPATATVTRTPGAGAVYSVELGKLRGQPAVRAALALVVVGPFVLAGGLSLQASVPADTLFGRWSLTTGFAVPLLVLGFATSWVVPLLTCLVAGTIFSAEDGYGTWPTVLTRSVSRPAVFAGKVLAAVTWSVLSLVLLALSSLAAGVLIVGRAPLIGLDGASIATGRATGLVLASWATCLVPALGYTAMGVFFSVLARRSTVGVGAPVVIGLVMQLSSLVGAVTGVRFLLLGSAFDAWHALVRTDPYRGPVLQGALVSVAYVLVLLAAALEIFRRRDESGARR